MKNQWIQQQTKNTCCHDKDSIFAVNLGSTTYYKSTNEHWIQTIMRWRQRTELDPEANETNEIRRIVDRN